MLSVILYNLMKRAKSAAKKFCQNNEMCACVCVCVCVGGGGGGGGGAVLF